MASRDPADLEPGLLVRWYECVEEWTKRHGCNLTPRLSATYRSKVEQGMLYAKHKLGGPRAAPPGQSLHNYHPSFALDFFFVRASDGKAVWDAAPYRLMGEIAKGKGLAWAGDWSGPRDFTHLECPAFTWQMAAAGELPQWDGP